LVALSVPMVLVRADPGGAEQKLAGGHRRLTVVSPKPHHPRTPPSTATSSGHSGGERNGDVDHAQRVQRRRIADQDRDNPAKRGEAA